MTNLTIEYVALALLGMIIHILMHVLNRKNKTIPISFGYYISDVDNWIRVILSVLSIFALLMMSESLANMLGIQLSDGSPAKDVFAFITGYMNHSLIKNVLRFIKK